MLALVQLALQFLHRQLVNREQGHHLVEETSRKTNVNCCLDFVSREHPHLDASPANEPYGIGNILLKLVFDGGGADEFQILFNKAINFGYLFVPIIEV